MYPLLRSSIQGLPNPQGKKQPQPRRRLPLPARAKEHPPRRPFRKHLSRALNLRLHILQLMSRSSRRSRVLAAHLRRKGPRLLLIQRPSKGRVVARMLIPWTGATSLWIRLDPPGMLQVPWTLKHRHQLFLTTTPARKTNWKMSRQAMLNHLQKRGPKLIPSLPLLPAKVPEGFAFPSSWCSCWLQDTISIPPSRHSSHPGPPKR